MKKEDSSICLKEKFLLEDSRVYWTISDLKGPTHATPYSIQMPMLGIPNSLAAQIQIPEEASSAFCASGVDTTEDLISPQGPQSPCCLVCIGILRGFLKEHRVFPAVLRQKHFLPPFLCIVHCTREVATFI